ncbi:MAG: hypothetical protein AB7H93_25285 [Vicinamibacterales bacterium]
MSLTIEAEARINALLDTALQRLEGQVVLANRPCVDALLDLYGASDDASVRRVCTDALRRISRVSLVRAEELRADLQAVAAAAASASIGAGPLAPSRLPDAAGVAEAVS